MRDRAVGNDKVPIKAPASGTSGSGSYNATKTKCEQKIKQYDFGEWETFYFDKDGNVTLWPAEIRGIIEGQGARGKVEDEFEPILKIIGFELAGFLGVNGIQAEAMVYTVRAELNINIGRINLTVGSTLGSAGANLELNIPERRFKIGAHKGMGMDVTISYK